ncbi:marine_srt_targ, marine proteobacterial sortase target protein [Oxalobacteraceae bacterium]
MSASTETNHKAILEGTKGQSVLLQKIDIEAHVDGLLFTVKARQFYKNTSKKNIETIYTFPLAWGCTLLGLTATMAGKTWQGTVLPKSEAEENYEKAIKEGDTPIMVEKSGEGLYTAHMGNLKPDEEAIIEVEYAQLLKIEQGQVRLAIPTTVAPRYGDPVKTGKLKKPASVDASLAASYPLSVTLSIEGVLAQGAISCPSHQTSIRTDGGKSVVCLTRDGYLDRDLVVVVDEVASQPVFSVATHEGEFPVLFSFTPAFTSQATALASEIELKILVDCSGSMEGDSIVLARNGLKSLLPLLSSADKVSYSLFGSKPRRVVGKLTAATPEFKAKSLDPAIDKTYADLGGTEMHAALTDTFKIKAESNERPVNVLLITDGEVWDIENIIQAARESNHRIFAIGVGSSPADSLLREIAEHSDGACELVSPNEDMAAAMQRMVNRMRQGVVAGLSVDWQVPVVWQSPVPKVVYPGETIHLAAILGEKPSHVPLLTVTASSLITTPMTANAVVPLVETENTSTETVLTRIVGAKLLRDALDAEAASLIAMRYQLVTEHTNLFMVVQRAADEKALGLPEPHQIKQMVAAGWHGMGSVRQLDVSASRVLYSMARVAPLRSSSMSKLVACYDTPQFMRRQADIEMLGIEPMALLAILEDIAMTYPDFEDAMTRLLNCGLPSEIESLIGVITDELTDRVLAWAVFLDWLIGALGQEKSAPRQVKRLLDHTLASIRDDSRDEIHDRLSACLPDIQEDRWGTLADDPKTLEFNELIIRQNI